MVSVRKIIIKSVLYSLLTLFALVYVVPSMAEEAQKEGEKTETEKQNDTEVSRREKAFAKRVDTLEQDLADLKSVRKQMASDLKKAEKLNKDLAAERDDLAKSNAKLNKQNAEVIRREKVLVEQVSTIEKEVSSLRIAGKKVAPDLDAAMKRCEKLVAERDDFAKQVDVMEELPKKLNHLRKYVNDLEKDRKKLQSQIVVLEKRLADKKSRKDRNGRNEDSGLLAKIERLEQENTDLRESLARQGDMHARLLSGGERVVPGGARAVKSSDDISERLEQANAFFEKGLTDKAEEVFNEVLKKEPENFDANLGLAYCYYTKSYYSQALALANRLRQEYPENARALKLIGLTEWRRGHLVEASDALKQALKSEPESAHLHNYLAVICHSLGDYEMARHEFMRAVELDDQLVEAYFSLAVLLTSPEKLDLKGAKEYYEKAIQLGRRRNEDLEKILYR